VNCRRICPRRRRQPALASHAVAALATPGRGILKIAYTAYGIMMNWTSIALVLAFFLATICEDRPLKAQDARRRFEKEARKVWREYIELATHLQGTFSSERIDRRGAGEVFTPRSR